MPVPLIREAISILAPKYGLKAEAFLSWADAYSESFNRAMQNAYYVPRREPFPEACQRRLAAGGLVGKLLFTMRNPDLGEDVLSTFFKQVGAVFAAQIVHSTTCSKAHEELPFKDLANRVADFCVVKKRTETTRMKKQWPNYEGKVMPLTDQALRAMAYTLGTEMGMALHAYENKFARGDAFECFVSIRPAEAPKFLQEVASQVQGAVAAQNPAWHAPITKPISRFFARKD